VIGAEPPKLIECVDFKMLRLNPKFSLVLKGIKLFDKGANQKMMNNHFISPNYLTAIHNNCFSAYIECPNLDLEKKVKIEVLRENTKHQNLHINAHKKSLASLDSELELREGNIEYGEIEGELVCCDYSHCLFPSKRKEFTYENGILKIVYEMMPNCDEVKLSDLIKASK